eukprot:14414027-Alexandrium_andersonii.AAC.1
MQCCRGRPPPPPGPDQRPPPRPPLPPSGGWPRDPCWALLHWRPGPGPGPGLCRAPWQRPSSLACPCPRPP